MSRHPKRLSIFGLSCMAMLLAACQSPLSSQQEASAARPSSAVVDEGLLRPDMQSLGAQLLGAAQSGDTLLVRQLLAKSADVNVKEPATGDTPLLKAVRGQHVDVVRSLLLAGASPNLQNAMSDSAFLLAGAMGQTEALRMMLSYGADLKRLNRFGGTALIPACERGHVEAARLLIGVGVDVNHVNRLGWTCLMEAVVLSDGGPRHQAIIQALIEAGADLNLPDKDGVTALAHARQRGQAQVVQLLQKAGAR